MGRFVSKHIEADYEALSEEAALFVYKRITAALNNSKPFVLGVATGSTPIGLYQYLVHLLADRRIDLSKFYTVNLDEYYPMKQTDSHSYYQYMKFHFWEPLQKANPTFEYEVQGFIPSGETDNPEAECLVYEERIKQRGGIDLQILGIGVNGHIGFNEPGSSPSSRTRVVTLSPETVSANSRFYKDDISQMPKKAITMGLGTILEAGEILLLASGKSKESIMRKLVALDKPDQSLPASYLLQHPRVTYILDIDASGT